LRAIIADAKVNLAAVHYHFHSKQALLLAVVDRRIRPINQERLRYLGEYERASGGEPIPVENILRAFIAPAFWLSRTEGADVFMHLMGRLYAESGEVARMVFSDQFQEVAEVFVNALAKALPNFPRAQLMLRLHFTIGAMAHTLRGTTVTEAVTEGFWHAWEADGVLDELIKFLSAGLKA
jgi:AcrR family transcriptional regulator